MNALATKHVKQRAFHTRKQKFQNSGRKHFIEFHRSDCKFLLVYIEGMYRGATLSTVKLTIFMQSVDKKFWSTTGLLVLAG